MRQGRTLEDLGRELERQRQSRKDFVADTRSLDFVTEDGESVIHVNAGGKLESFGVKDFTHQQIATRLQIPYRYYQKMQDKAPHLLDNNVNVWFQQTPERRLLRVMDGKVRAFLSDRYRRLDHLELCAAVLPIIQDMKGASIESCEVTESHM